MRDPIINKSIPLELKIRLVLSNLMTVLPLMLVAATLTLYYGGKLKLVLALAPVFFILSPVFRTFKTHLNRYSSFAMATLLVMFPLYIMAIQLAYFRDGEQGVDFAIFSQIITRVAQYSSPSTSLVGLDWNNFLTHHLSPYLIILGILGRSGVPAPYLLILTHTLSLAFLIFGVYRLICCFTKDNFVALCLTLMTCTLPVVRLGYSWETHDEILALPFIIWSLHAHFSGKTTRRLRLLWPTLLFKETLALNVFVLAIGYSFFSDTSKERAKCITLAVISLVIFLAYTKLFPGWLWPSSFNGLARISSLEQLMEPAALKGKLKWLLILLAPCLTFLLLILMRFFEDRDLKPIFNALLILSATAYNLAAILVTNFPNMYFPYNYYSITPAVLTFLAVASVSANSRYVILCALLSLFPICFSGWRVNTYQLVGETFVRPPAYTELKSVLKESQVIVADDYTTSLLTDQSRVIRLFHANLSDVMFDRIVLRKAKLNEPGSVISDSLKARSKVCDETPRFIIRCPS